MVHPELQRHRRHAVAEDGRADQALQTAAMQVVLLGRAGLAGESD
jgi:hypothetical protein